MEEAEVWDRIQIFVDDLIKNNRSSHADPFRMATLVRERLLDAGFL